MRKLLVYNSLSRKKEEFVPLNPPFAGLYVCGPTVYGDAHLGHARPYITFDVLYRLLENKEIGPGYKVRYVRNITDVGHLENDSDSGEDKISKKARLEQLEPMEVVQQYTLSFHRNMEQLNTLPPSIEPLASGHIIEQIEMVKAILENGLAYVSNGSVYFDVRAYNRNHQYGKLSGRVLEELLDQTRDLDGQEEKRFSADFALWKKAQPEHIMRWPSPWGDGFPGWHIECSAMSAKYLGEPFDIHGGGMDLLFPHHECEIAQSVGAKKTEPARYWMHNNMITINGQKMGKSLGNFITLNDLFSGNNPLLEKAYSPMTIRFFILQAHYRSTLDFSNEALQAAEKGMKRLLESVKSLKSLNPADFPESVSGEANEKAIAALNASLDHLFDDLNTAQTLARIFDLGSIFFALANGQTDKKLYSSGLIEQAQKLIPLLLKDILGIEEEQESGSQHLQSMMELVLDLRKSARERKDFATSDQIRDRLKAAGIILKDNKDGSASWSIE